MAEDRHRHSWVDLQRNEQAGAGPPGCMHGDDRYPRLHRAELEVAVEVARVDGVTVLGRADEPAFTPQRARREPSPILVDPVPLERPHSDLGQRQRGIRTRGLRVPAYELPVDPLNLPRDERLIVVEVDVLPRQPE